MRRCGWSRCRYILLNPVIESKNKNACCNNDPCFDGEKVKSAPALYGASQEPCDLVTSLKGKFRGAVFKTPHSAKSCSRW